MLGASQEHDACDLSRVIVWRPSCVLSLVIELPVTVVGSEVQVQVTVLSVSVLSYTSTISPKLESA